MAPAILWFRRNLRLYDNTALIAAAASGHPLIPVYVMDNSDIGSASRWWLHHSLVSLDTQLREIGSSLLLLSGPPETAISKLIDESGAESVFYSRRYEPEARQQEESLANSCPAHIHIESFEDGYLGRHSDLLTKNRTPFRVFTPYWKAAIARGEPPQPQPVPESIRFAEHRTLSLSFDDLGLLPVAPNWARGFDDVWTPGEEGATLRLDDLDQAIQRYAEYRDRPDLDTTSRLSPHLHFGEISARQAWHAIRKAALHLHSSSGAEALTRQLYWRDFSAYLLFHFPSLADSPLRPEFEHFPWSQDDERLHAWQRGTTGYPIVDAGMRQLWATGWMHNRVRMIVASFLVKHLLVPWQQGAAWFLDTLVDADLANNSAGWQWVAGCGTDAAPYFRIFNPILQGRKFDPNGDYVRHWVPELAAMPDKFLHEPWRASRAEQASCGVTIGEDYPAPIVEHMAARKEALAAYQVIRSAAAADPVLSN
ncbi:MAG: DNA photolyase family protein [Gammaproteobacteria bacterium]|nr:DNA photolyase family protein [Gammaproteobacteria bacterium]MDH3430821.1 DNA photolyase family protein [Gammaproteobacteria bacterium]MDH3432977.1 DNA photolyase family protein [Gammaproteobacteria bacterium]